MVQHLIVPVDGSKESWKAFDVAHSLAVRCDADIRVVQVEYDPLGRNLAAAQLSDEVDNRGPFDIEVTSEVRLATDPVADELDRLVTMHPGSVVVMASHGKGRSAAILGSVTEALLQRSFGPCVLVGPHVEPDDFSGPVLVTVDGSDESETALPLGAAWATELRATPWVVNVSEPNNSGLPAGGDVLDSNYPARLAHELQSACGHPVEFEGLHGKHPAVTVADYASRHDASLIVAASHGRSGISRFTLGSVVSGFVRHATCPVLVTRLPRTVTADGEIVPAVAGA